MGKETQIAKTTLRKKNKVGEVILPDSIIIRKLLYQDTIALTSIQVNEGNWIESSKADPHTLSIDFWKSCKSLSVKTRLSSNGARINGYPKKLTFDYYFASYPTTNSRGIREIHEGPKIIKFLE